jgi:hypothetical protein
VEVYFNQGEGDSMDFGGSELGIDDAESEERGLTNSA